MLAKLDASINACFVTRTPELVPFPPRSRMPSDLDASLVLHYYSHRRRGSDGLGAVERRTVTEISDEGQGACGENERHPDVFGARLIILRHILAHE